jgi:hypothetical protein
MRQAVTWIVTGNRWKSVFDPSIPISEQKAWIKKQMTSGLLCDWIEHWTSDHEKRKFHPPKPLQAKTVTKRMALKV